MDDLIKYIPEKWRGTLLLLIAVSPYITRAYHALMAGGGLKGVFSAIWLGTNGPKPKDKPEDPKPLPPP